MVNPAKRLPAPRFGAGRRRWLPFLLPLLLSAAATAGAESRGATGAVNAGAVDAASAARRPLAPADFYREQVVEDVALSADGRLVAYTVMSVREEKNDRHREIWLQALERGKPLGAAIRVTSPLYSSTRPVFSPDGSLLAFESNRGEDKNKVWFLRLVSPGGEAFHLPGVEGLPEWSADGRTIAFTKPVDRDGEEKEAEKKADPKEEEREGWISPSALTHTLDAKRFDGRVVTSMRYKEDGELLLRPDPAVRDRRQLFVAPAAGGAATQVTRLPFDAGAPSFAPGGHSVYFAGDPLEDDETNDQPTSELYRLDLGPEGAAGESVRLTENPGGERAPMVSPTGRFLAYLFERERGAQTELMVVALDAAGGFTGAPRNLTADWDYEPRAPRWLPGDRSLRFLAEVRGQTHVFEVAPGGGKVKPVTRGERTIAAAATSGDGATLAFAATDPLHPSDLFVAQGDGSAEQAVTQLNADWLATVELVPPERLTWRAPDGTEVEGWLQRPVGYAGGQAHRYPMVLKIHGGPHSSYGSYWFRAFHIFSGAGMFVLYTNPRGSSGYGHSFEYATRGRWGEVDREDYLAAVDLALSRYPEIDPDRVAVSGGSYGGFMTNWLTATTDRFAAAVTSRSITNWESWYGASDAQGLTEYEFYGPPWEQRELYRKLSPISYVENVTAPTLIIHSENDYRTPIADGEQWFMALRKRGVPVELVRYPRSSHGLSRTGEPWLLVDRLERQRSWLVHWLIDQPAAPAAPAAAQSPSGSGER